MLTEHMAQVRDATGRVVELDELARRLERASRSHLQRVGFLRLTHFVMRAAIRALPSP